MRRRCNKKSRHADGSFCYDLVFLLFDIKAKDAYRDGDEADDLADDCAYGDIIDIINQPYG